MFATIRIGIILMVVLFCQNSSYSQGYWGYSTLIPPNSFVRAYISFGGDSSLFFTNNSKIIYQSKNNGETFEPKYQFNDSGFIASILTVSDSMIISAWDYYLKVSFDGGDSWDTMRIKVKQGDTITTLPISFYYFWRNGRAIILSRPDTYIQDSCYNIYLSEDYGDTWIKKDCSQLNISEINGDNKRSNYRIS